MPHPQTVGNFRIGMAERYEIVIDFAKYTPGTARRAAQPAARQQRRLRHTRTSSWPSRSATTVVELGEQRRCPQDLNPNMHVMGLTEADSVRHAALPLRARRAATGRSTARTWEDVVNSDYEFVLANPRLRGRRDLGAREQVGRLVPPGPHPPRGLQDPRPQRQAAAAARARPEGRRLRRRERDGPRDHEVREPARAST